MDKTRQGISADGGDILGHEVWGRRKLTHMMGRAREGIYTFFKFRAAPALLRKLSHGLSIMDSVLRSFSVVAVERRVREKKPRAAAAAPAGRIG